MSEPGTLNLVVSAVAGLLSGAAGTYWLEGFYRPKRDKQRAAALLALEIDANGRSLYDKFEREEKRAEAGHVGMSSDLVLHRIALEAVSPHLRELPEKTAKGVLRVYQLYAHVEEMHRRRGEHFDEYMAAVGNPHKSESAASNFRVATRVWRKNIWYILQTTTWLYPELRSMAKMPPDTFPALPAEPVPVPEQAGFKSEATIPSE